MPTSTACTHIKVTGVRCASPSLRGEQFCYFHQHAHRGVRKPPQSRLHPIAILEDEESIQSSLMEVINALMRNTIDLKRAELILRALHIAVKNARRAKFDIHARDTVKEVPEYATASAPSDQSTESQTNDDQPEAYLPTEDAFPPMASIPPSKTLSAKEQRDLANLKEEQDRQADIRARLARAAAGVVNRPADVGTAAPGCSSGPAGRSLATTDIGADAFGPEVPVRSVVNPKPPIAEHTFKQTSDSKVVLGRKEDPPVPKGQSKIARRFSAGATVLIQKRAVGTPDQRPRAHAPRKPAATVQAPKERQNVAHGASRG